MRGRTANSGAVRQEWEMGGEESGTKNSLWRKLTVGWGMGESTPPPPPHINVFIPYITGTNDQTYLN